MLSNTHNTPNVMSMLFEMQQEQDKKMKKELRLARENLNQLHDKTTENDDDNSVPENTNEFDWTKTYQKWDNWEDPEELQAKRRAEVERLEKELQRAPCFHDKSAERKVVEMSIAEKISWCEQFKLEGNDLFLEGQYYRALQKFTKALVYYEYCFPDSVEEETKLEQIRLTNLLNCAACELKLKMWTETIQHCYQALKIDPENVKALYRRAKAYRMKDEYDLAKNDILHALQLQPKDSMLQKEYIIIQNKVASYRFKSHLLGQQMIQGNSFLTIRRSLDLNNPVVPTNPSEISQANEDTIIKSITDLYNPLDAFNRPISDNESWRASDLEEIFG